MNRNSKIILDTLVWTALAVYLVLAAGYCSRQQSDRICTGLNIVVKDSVKIGLLSRSAVRDILVGHSLSLTGAPLDSINLAAVEEILVSHPMVQSVRVYSSLNGRLNIELEQRRPVARIQTENGYRFFLSADEFVMPLKSASLIDVPLVTGLPEFTFGTDFEGEIPAPEETEKKSLENYKFLQNLINFVKFVERDPFWNAQIVQIHVLPGNEVELIPRLGRGMILLGDFAGYRKKLDKLYKFYQRGLAYEGWNKYACINLKYEDQVVCTQ
ncbi:MAG: hypothetical protein LUD68_04650 [Rikenellaceae bacterium]|nr:hypothetical protein [Rikenellaceae bacterium]